MMDDAEFAWWCDVWHSIRDSGEDVLAVSRIEFPEAGQRLLIVTTWRPESHLWATNRLSPDFVVAPYLSRGRDEALLMHARIFGAMRGLSEYPEPDKLAVALERLANEPPTGSHAGQMYSDLGTGLTYIHDGTAWQIANVADIGPEAAADIERARLAYGHAAGRARPMG